MNARQEALRTIYGTCTCGKYRETTMGLCGFCGKMRPADEPSPDEVARTLWIPGARIRRKGGFLTAIVLPWPEEGKEPSAEPIGDNYVEDAHGEKRFIDSRQWELVPDTISQQDVVRMVLLNQIARLEGKREPFPIYYGTLPGNVLIAMKEKIEKGHVLVH